MLRSILINEAIKTLKKKRTYISFILLFFLVPLIVLAIGNGSGYLEMQIYGQLKDSFIVFGSLTNGFLSSYLIIAILVGQMPFLATIVAAEIVSGEYSKGTFRMYLTRPISRNNVLLSKLIDAEWDAQGMTRHSKVYDKLNSILNEEWREKEELEEIKDDMRKRKKEKQEFKL